MKNAIIIKKLVLSGLFLALGFILPLLFGGNQQLGMTFLPMHLPILLCGFVCGWQYGLIVGFITPLLKSFLTSMPPLFPSAAAMSLELGTYGLMAGLMFILLPKKNINVYISLITSMVIGRIVWGISSLVFAQITGNDFTWKIFISNAVLNSIPGIVIQIVLIPIIIIALEKAGFIDGKRDLQKN